MLWKQWVARGHWGFVKGVVNARRVGFYPTYCDAPFLQTQVRWVKDGGVGPHPTLTFRFGANQHRVDARVGEGRGRKGLVSWAGGVAGVPSGDEDVVVAGGGLGGA
jgi:hypothetical protein